MALEKFEYPATGVVTNSFLPSKNADPEVEPNLDKLDEGIIPDDSSGKQRYNYEEGIRIRFHRRYFHRHPASERTSYESFRDVVGGKTFKFTDFNGAARTVTVEIFERDFKYEGIGEGGVILWSWLVVMREEL